MNDKQTKKKKTGSPQNAPKPKKTRADRRDSQVIARTFVAETDRGCILIAASLLDQALTELLGSYMRADGPDVKHARKKLMGGPMAPFGSFSAKIATAYLLGLIGHDVYAYLEALREARNKCAHEYHHIDFLAPEVSKAGMLVGLNDEEREVLKEGEKTLDPTLTGEDKARKLAKILLARRTYRVMGRIDAMADHIIETRRVAELASRVDVENSEKTKHLRIRMLPVNK